MAGLRDGLQLRRTVTYGAIGGATVLYLALVGLVEAFEQRNVVLGQVGIGSFTLLNIPDEVVTLGRVMLLAVVLIVGYRIAILPRIRSGPRPTVAQRLTSGLIAGAITGFMLGLLVLLGSAIDVRGVLLRVSPALVAFLSFGLPPAGGVAALTGFGALFGALGAGLLVLPPRYRGPISNGLVFVLLMSMAEPFVRPRLEQLEYTAISSFLYKSHGVTLIAAIAIFAVTAAVTVIWGPASRRVRQGIAASPPGRVRQIRAGAIAVALFGVLFLPLASGTFFAQVLVLIGLYLLLALGLNIVVGYAGLLDLGYVAFFAVGAYLTALLTSPHSALGIGLPFFVALPVVMVAAAMTGLLIGAPVLRLRGDYLAIVTLGFGEIARILFESEALGPWLGGVQGILGVPSPFPQKMDLNVGFIHLSASGPQVLYYPILGFCVLAAIAASRLANSRTGRAWNAMREDESVAEATGVSTVNYKLLAFALGATTGCLSGALFAVQLKSVFPGSFDVLVSITVLAVIILGGMGSIRGVIVGAIVLIGLPQLLREFAEYRLLVYGGVLVAMMLFRPEGLVPSSSRQRELHQADEAEEVAEPAIEASASGGAT